MEYSTLFELPTRYSSSGGRGGSLGDLLGALSCPFDQLHCAGNDANFTLRDLLSLATRDLVEQSG